MLSSKSSAQSQARIVGISRLSETPYRKLVANRLDWRLVSHVLREMKEDAKFSGLTAVLFWQAFLIAPRSDGGAVEKSAGGF